MGLEWGQVSLVRITEGLFGWKSTHSGLENSDKRPWGPVELTTRHLSTSGSVPRSYRQTHTTLALGGSHFVLTVYIERNDIAWGCAGSHPRHRCVSYQEERTHTTAGALNETSLVLEECRLLGCDAVCLVQQPTFRRNVSPTEAHYEETLTIWKESAS
jgi:hypothetical protein